MRQSNATPTNLRNVDLNLLKVFQAVLAEQSISQAAAMLCVSQPAVSNALRRLRELYSDPLFVRTANGMIPTARAQELSRPINRALEDIAQTLVTDEAFRPDTSQRVMNVALTDYGELYFLPRIVRRLAREAPGMEVSCLPNPGATLGLDMRSGAVDLVWDWVTIDDPDFVVEPVFCDAGYCLARKGHPKIDGELSLETFLEVEHVALLPTRGHTPRVELTLEKKGLARKVITEVSHLVVMPQIVATTDLVATMPERLARFYAREMDLQVLPNPLNYDEVVVYQMWHRHFENDDGHRWFRQLTAKISSEA
ncbi:LysR substrate-binding domain-containing protein [Kineobactrum salinum]|uniref:LysR family transcriptional regulator n=1 Tax=Kineobactrum salinum TaxID=2708301 RepID=A0A6C0TWE7_9GAMM|nr:LysR substrate-binding domain-containing protein [Kineobactrum salinum]QIB64142.1 LysR family transcriptional regulator [Kineobactrum salinum]